MEVHYSIRSLDSDLVLTGEGYHDKIWANIVMDTYNGGDHQHWLLKSNGDI